MTFANNGIKAVLFDYGNTLIEYGPRQVKAQYVALAKELSRLFGHCDFSRLKAIRDRQALAPFHNGYVENDMKLITGELIEEMYQVIPEEAQIWALIETRYRAFVHATEVSSDVPSLLIRLRDQYRLGLVSNYPCSRSIEDSLKKTGLRHFFEVVVVSGDLGYAKPHPKPFETMLDHLKLHPEECLFVGDNWLADIQGAKRMGMPAILISQYAPYGEFKPSDGDHQPDATISHLSELDALLLS
ncbi:MAG: HAD family hydrolase [Deltaproteobacteria bacterium]|nr:HAD family hydrolase [Deltaproteobacteria bacterium]